MPSPGQPQEHHDHGSSSAPPIEPYHPPHRFSPLNVNSGVHWKLPSINPSSLGIFGDEISAVEQQILNASIVSPSGETGLTFHDYTLGRVLAALAGLRLAPDGLGRERTVQSLLRMAVGAEFNHGNFRTFVENMLESSSAEVLTKLYQIDREFAESARLITIEILCFPPLAGLLFATAKEVQETVLTSCRASLVRELDVVREEGNSIEEPNIFQALFKMYTREFEEILNDGLPNSLANPNGTRSLEEAVNRLYAKVVAHLQVTFQQSGYLAPPGYVKHEPTSFDTRELLEDLFVLVRHNRLTPEKIIEQETASKYLRMLREWEVTAKYYGSMKDPLTDQLPRGTRPMIAELQSLADLTPKDFRSSGADSSYSLYPNSPVITQPPARGNPRSTDRTRTSYQARQEHDEVSSDSSDTLSLGSFFNIMFDASLRRGSAIFAVAALATGLHVLSHDYRAVLVGLAALLLTYDKPERFNTTLERLGASTLRGASTGALVAGAMSTPIPGVGQIRYLLDLSPVPTDFLSLMVGAAVISEFLLWGARASEEADDEGY